MSRHWNHQLPPKLPSIKNNPVHYLRAGCMTHAACGVSRYEIGIYFANTSAAHVTCEDCLQAMREDAS